MKTYWAMVAARAWQKTVADFKRFGTTAIASLLTFGVLIAVGAGAGQLPLTFIGVGILAVLRFGWTMLTIPPQLHRAQVVVGARAEIAGELEALWKEGKSLANDSARGSEPWAGLMSEWDGRVLTALGRYSQEERVMYETIVDELPQPGSAMFAFLCMQHYEAKLGKLRLIVGRAYQAASVVPSAPGASTAAP